MNTNTLSEPLADTRDMRAVHTVFRRELGLGPALVRAVPPDDRTRTALVASHLELVSQLLHAHHAGEDKHLWPRLRARGAKGDAAVVDAMEEQHEGIHRSLLHVTDTLESWRKSPSAHTRDALAAAIARLLPFATEHLDDEEERALPLIEKYITAAEYAVEVKEALSEVPPDKLPVLFGMLMYETAPAVVDTIVSQMPPAVQRDIRQVSSRAYSAHAKDVYGTATPPRVT
jgi:hypothetical protein